MAITAQSISTMPSSLSWLEQFLKDELSPYGGRTALVARMVIAATVVMMICVVFRIPYAFQGAIYALIVSRESSQATFKSAASILSMTGIGAAYLLASAWFVISIPMLHLLWVIASFFLGFYAISTIKNFGASSTFAIVICDRLSMRPTTNKCGAPGHGGNVHVAAHLTPVCLCTELCRTNGCSDRSYRKTGRSCRQCNESH